MNTIDQFQNRLKEYTGKKINIVMSNRTVLFGELKGIEGDQLTFINMRQRPVSLLLKDITEVYLDSKDPC